MPLPLPLQVTPQGNLSPELLDPQTHPHKAALLGTSHQLLSCGWFWGSSSPLFTPTTAWPQAAGIALGGLATVLCSQTAGPSTAGGGSEVCLVCDPAGAGPGSPSPALATPHPSQSPRTLGHAPRAAGSPASRWLSHPLVQKQAPLPPRPVPLSPPVPSYYPPDLPLLLP